MKLLLTSVGRRIELIQSFRTAAEKTGISLCIYGADISSSAPALAFCDRTVLVPRISDKNYIPELQKICAEEGIDALIPTIDTDLLLLAENRGAFGQTRVFVSAPEKIRICRNKNLTSAYFQSVGLHSPNAVNDIRTYEGGFPAFIKPMDGSSSINAFKVDNMTELETYAEQVPDYIIQPYIEGTEYTVDIFCGPDGEPVYITPRIRLAVRAVEVLKTQIVQDETIIKEVKQLVKDFHPFGQITVQLIREKTTGTDYYIEINPRFGGGAPLSIKAGADSAEAVLRIINGDVLSYQAYAAKDGSIYSRFDQSVRVDSQVTPSELKGIVFDLDDTLYSEADYVKSGYRKIAEYLHRPEAEKRLWIYFLEKLPAIDRYLEEIGETSQKENCLEIYREQVPEIELYPGVKEILLKLKNNGKKIGIITDGRPSGQRKKIDALGLSELVDDILITDELGGPQFRKPNDVAFRIMKTKWRLPFEDMLYIGDNPLKDFQAPKQLGMQCIYFNNSQGLYSGVIDIPNLVQIFNLKELKEFLWENG